MRIFSLVFSLVVCLGSGFISADEVYWQKYRPSSKQKQQIEHKKPVRIMTSLIIPCYYKHAANLYPLLRMYEQQTRLPDEVVISLSEAHRVDPALLEQLRKERWAFQVTLVVSDKKKLAGENRNTACAYAFGDVMICQDADDIVHPQRIEVIHYFFSHYKIDHLMHQYAMIEPGAKNSLLRDHIDPDAVRFIMAGSHKDALKVRGLTNGNVAVAKYVLNTVQWTSKPRGQDTEFNRNVYKKFKRCIAINATLYGYRQYLSSLDATAKGSDDFDAQVTYTHTWPKRYAVHVIRER